MHAIVRNSLFAFTLVGSSGVMGQAAPEYMKLMSAFAMTDYAVSKCMKPDAELLAKFNSNKLIAMSRGLDEWRKKKPDVTEQQLSEAVQKGNDGVKRQVDGIVSSAGCSDARIQGVLKRFDELANLKL